MNNRLKKFTFWVTIFLFGSLLSYALTKSLNHQNSFFQRFINNPTQVGAIAESSEGLAEAITTCTGSLKNTQTPCGKNMLEVGAGTGVFTQYIINNMTPSDTLDVVEYDPVFYKQLQNRFGKYPHVKIFRCSIADFKPAYQYDCIISGLPFNAFPPALVEKILHVYEQSLKPSGCFAYFEYIALPVIKQLGLCIGGFFSKKIKEDKIEFDQTRTLVIAFKKKFESATETLVVLNLPPARAITCRGLKKPIRPNATLNQASA